ncbi:transmembrane protein 268-like isoform X4 [Daphnia carinata]|uniref:transmembrane protein 268-like isoform X4 n=1 Tax=Daphnia carinata TaxID=120202 RepID=UPI00257DCA71|nr:transmembrane protein 268-like isoform X4 [Daphnia carinata]
MSDKMGNEEQRSSPVEKKWVQFDENNELKPSNHTENPPAASTMSNYNGAVIDTETVQIDIDKLKQLAQLKVPEGDVQGEDLQKTVNPTMRNINLDDLDGAENNLAAMVDPSIQRGFSNGDVIVTVLPVNQKWPWITPAEFRPELVPEELMAEGLSLTVEDYVQIMETLVHDVRFTAYNLCYKRLLMAWLLASFIVLLGLLFSGAKGITLFGCGVIWLIINAGAIFVCMWMKNKMNHGLEKAVAKANQTLTRHRIILGVDDRGKLSCHKTHLCFIYFDTTDCVRKLQALLDAEGHANRTETNAEDLQRQRQMRQRMDIDDTDIVVAGANPIRISRKQARAGILLLRYSQRWAKGLARGSLDLQLLAAINAYNATAGGGGGGNQSSGTSNGLPVSSPVPPTPLHCATSQCPCQYIQNHLYNKANPAPNICWKMPNFGFH